MGIKTIWGRFREKAVSFLAAINEAAQTRRKLIFLGFGGAILLLLLCLITIVVVNPKIGGGSDESQELIDAFGPLPIPPEELFLPDEPDFLPEVLLGREPRESWTTEDARPFWKDPREGSADLWRERVGAAVDELLERVP
ncbi:MAG: hypothetical protein LBP32_01715 [Spirochaetaceae bacterium]|nr:hypothetical protein [Spirochaetaceae bacterium]